MESVSEETQKRTAAAPFLVIRFKRIIFFPRPSAETLISIQQTHCPVEIALFMPLSYHEIMLFLYDSLSQQKKLLKKTRRRVQMFVCGPTVYDLAHIGHARTYIAFDIIARWLRHRKHNLFYLQNITDVDDKIIERARRFHQHPFSLAKKLEKEYRKDMRTLDIVSVNAYARASDHISHIVSQVRTLIKNGYAYLIKDDGYYFNLSAFPEYGKLSRRTTEQAQDAVSRIDESIQKRNKGDFCLWKLAAPQNIAEIKTRDAGHRGKKPVIIHGEPAWHTKLGWGRPGWHIEDTAITEHFFGPQYDIHGGGVDLKFPHHEAEIAQQESASGKKPFVRIWMHTGHLLVQGEKMSKSLGNIITIRDFLHRHSVNTLRYIVSSVHYTTPLDYTETIALQANAALAKIDEIIQRLCQLQPPRKARGASGGGVQIVKKFELDFSSAMDDDVNTPRALASIFALLHEIESHFETFSATDIKKVSQKLQWALAILGITVQPLKIPARIKALVEKRKLFRHTAQWKEADTIRNTLVRQGYKLDDTPYGTIMVKEKTVGKEEGQ